MTYAAIWLLFGLCTCIWINYRDRKAKPGFIVNLSIIGCGPIGLILLIISIVFGQEGK